MISTDDISSLPKVEQNEDWNSFDRACGINREELVHYALDNATNIELRHLLSSEIKHVVVNEFYLRARKKSVAKLEALKNQNQIALDSLYFIASSNPNDEKIQRQVQIEINEIFETNTQSEKQLDIYPDIPSILPQELCTEDFYDLADEFLKVIEMKEFNDTYLRCCKDLGYNYLLNLFVFDKFFSNEANRIKYQNTYQDFMNIRLKLLAPVETKITDFCESISVYRKYVMGIYAARKSFTVQVKFTQGMTSMVDVVARMLNKTIVIHLNSQGNIAFVSKGYGKETIHILYKAPSVFIRLTVEENLLSTTNIPATTSNKKSTFTPKFQQKLEGNSIESEQEELKTKLEKAYLVKDFMVQCKVLRDLALFYFKKKNYSTTAKLLNGAISLYDIHSLQYKDADLRIQLIEKLKDIEPSFIKDQLGIPYKPRILENYGINPQHKKRLSEIRAAIRKRIYEVNSLPAGQDFVERTKEIFVWITEQINALIKQLVLDCIDLLGEKPPCSYAVVGTGSLPRLEMTPYSDLEFFILVSDAKCRDYFKKLAQLLELKIINFGETDLVKGLNILPASMKSPTPKGFSLDIHKNPSNTEHELVGTPEEIASFQREDNYVEEKTNHLSWALLNTIFITGDDEELLFSYQNQVAQLNNQIDQKTQKPLRIERALRALSSDVEHFKPKYFADNQGEQLHTKEQLYRLPQTIMDAFALYQDLQCSSTLERIDELSRKKFILEEGKKRLKHSFSLALWWRLRTYCHYDAQEEMIDIMHRLKPAQSQVTSKSNHPQGVSQKDLDDLVYVITTFMALNVCAEKFFETEGKENSFGTNLLFEIPQVNIGLALIRLYQIGPAIEVLETAVKSLTVQGAEKFVKSYHPLLTCYIALGGIYCETGAYEKTVSCYKQALEVLDSTHMFENEVYGNVLNNLGWVYREMGRFQDALIQFEEAVKRYNKDDTRLAGILCNRALVYRDLNDIDKAFVDHENSLRILKSSNGDIPLLRAKNYNGLGLACLARRNAAEAIKYFSLALNIFIEKLGIEHPNVAKIYNNFGSLYFYEDPIKAKGYYESALMIEVAAYGWHNPNVKMTVGFLNQTMDFIIKRFFNFGIGTKELTIACYEQVIYINTNAHGENYFLVLLALTELGNFYLSQGNHLKALENFKRILDIHEKNNGSIPPMVLPILNQVGDIYFLLGEKENAHNAFEKGYNIAVQKYGPYHAFSQQFSFKKNNLQKPFMQFQPWK